MDLHYLQVMGSQPSLVYEDEKQIGDQVPKLVKGSLLQSIVHRSIGAIYFEISIPQISTKRGSGSAVALSRNLLLTSAHNLYDKRLRSKHTNFKFYLCPNGAVGRYYQVESVRFLEEFKTCRKEDKLQYDYALVKLKQNLPYSQYPQIAIPCQSCLLKEETYLQFYGYASSVEDESLRKIYQAGLREKGKITFIKPKQYKISYAMSTCGGFSGCPVMNEGKIIGIHTGCNNNPEEQYNIGRYLTCDAIKNLIKWAAQLKGDRFSINYLSCSDHMNNEPRLRQQLQMSYRKIKDLQNLLNCEKANNIELVKKKDQLLQYLVGYDQKIKELENKNKQLQNKIKLLERRPSESTVKRLSEQLIEQRMSRGSPSSLESVESILAHHPSNSHKEFYSLTRAATAKIIHKGQQEGWYNFVNSLELTPNSQTKYAIRLLKVTNSCLYIGFCTQKGFGNLNSQQLPESSYYYCGGYLWSGGNKSKLNQISKEGDTIDCIADLIRFKFKWIKGGKIIAECPIPEIMRDKCIYFSFQLLSQNDEVEVFVEY